MKRVVLVFLSVIFLSAIVSGQWYNKYYPDRQLSDLNQSELQILHKKALELRGVGIGFSSVGIVVSGIGSFVVIIAAFIDLASLIETGELSVKPSVYQTGFAVMFIGLGAALIGIPLWISGGTRSKEITEMLKFRTPNTSVTLAPSVQFIQGKNNFAPGLSISVRF